MIREAVDPFLGYISVAKTLHHNKKLPPSESPLKKIEFKFINYAKELAVFVPTWQKYPSLGLQRAPTQLKEQSQSKLDKCVVSMPASDSFCTLSCFPILMDFLPLF